MEVFLLNSKEIEVSASSTNKIQVLFSSAGIPIQIPRKLKVLSGILPLKVKGDRGF